MMVSELFFKRCDKFGQLTCPSSTSVALDLGEAYAALGICTGGGGSSYQTLASQRPLTMANALPISNTAARQ